MSTMPPFQNPFQAWVDAWGKMAPSQATAQTTPGSFPASFPFAAMPFAAPGAFQAQPWMDAWMKAFSQPLSGQPVAGKPVDALSALRLLWVDLPVEVAGRLQKFTSERMQDQMRLLTELAAEESNVNPAMRYAGFVQQASLAWGTELLQIMELYQEKLLNTDRAPSEAPIHYPRAA